MKSFGILRTNAGLTTNVKVVVDGKYGLSLDSIDSAAELSASKYKKMSFNKENYYDELLPNFWKGLPAGIAYQIKYDDDAASMTDDFAAQYDEIYQYGARNIVNNKNYSEEFEYFAPLYITKGKLPKNFIIFRVDGPGMQTISRFSVRKDIFRNLKVVKLFDLTSNTALGEWLDLNISKNEFFPETPFNMSFTKLEFSNWNGIDYTSGGYVSKSLFLDDVIEEEKEIFEMDKFVFDGYMKNKVIFPNIINFSFLFDDTPATAYSIRKWSINRYYGFYLEDLERMATVSPYITPFLKDDVSVKEGNILDSPSGDPFQEGWQDSRPFYVEYSGEYYKVEKFTETIKKSVVPVKSANTFNQTASAQLEDIGTSINTKAVSDKVSETVANRWRIISDKDLSGKEQLLNKNTGSIDGENFIIRYDQSPFEIKNFELSDVWVIEIDGVYHNLIKDGTKIKLCTDYSFAFYENYYEYWINKPDASFTKSVSFVVDSANAPKKFSIYRLRFSDVKDFDTRIVDTEYSKFEYEKKDTLTETEEPKLYLTNLNSTSNPKDLDDFIINDKVVKIPVSSEYTANHETFKVYGDELSQIWRKNPVYCRWAYENSLSSNDMPYLLNNSLVFGEHNMTTNTYHKDPSRKERNMDYFYTVNSSTFSYLHHTLHIEKNLANGIDDQFEFEFNKYLGIDKFSDGTSYTTYSVDYFTYFFERQTSFLSNEVKKNVKKYSTFCAGDSATPNISVFRGIKFLAYDVENIKMSKQGQIEKINLKTSNTFYDYKLSVLLTAEDNGMQWHVIERWEMDKKYPKGTIVSHDDILYIALQDSYTDTPVFNYSSPNQTYQIKSSPHSHSFFAMQSGYWTIRDTNKMPIAYNWDFYSDEYSILWNPAKEYNLNDVVYNHGNYYRMTSTGQVIDFWNPKSAYNRKYNIGSFVIFGGEYYTSNRYDNIYSPDNSQFWTKSPKNSIPDKWELIRLWNPGVSYATHSYVVHNHIVYTSDVKKINAGQSPDNKYGDWVRIYGIENETDFVYQPNENPLITMNNMFYLIKSNPNNNTLENGISVYINKKWKNILISISVKDNTLSGLSKTDRDSLYTSANRKLTANSFIEAINNLSNKYDFTDYVNYIVIDESGQKNYSFGGTLENRIEKLPFIIFAERPEPVDVMENSLEVKAVNEGRIKPTKELKDGRITHENELNYFNATHLATEILYDQKTPQVMPNYNGTVNITSRRIYRFGGAYSPLFYDIDLFKKDNSSPYNEACIILETNEPQIVYFKYERDGVKFERNYMINPGLSYSHTESPVLEYYTQVIEIINNEPELSDVEFKFDIKKTGVFSYPKSDMLLNLDSDLYNGTSTWGDLSPEFNNVSVENSAYTKTDLYPGSYFNCGSLTNEYSKTSKKIKFEKETTWEAWVKLDQNTSNSAIFMAARETYFGIYNGNSIVFGYTIGNQAKEMFSSNTLRLKTWYHIACTSKYDGTNTVLKIYVDGVENASRTHVGFQTTTNSDFYIGKGFSSNTKFAGSISAIRIYKRTLSSAEIFDNFINQYNALSVKYKSTYGDIKIKLDRLQPSIAMNIIDLSGETNRTFQMGATGGNPPYQWSFNGGNFSSVQNYTVPEYSTSHIIIVRDSIGLTSSSGYYTVNSESAQTYIYGGFSY